MWTRHPSVAGLVPCSPAFPETDIETITSGVGFVMTFANMTFVDTTDGPVVIDVGTRAKGKLLLASLQKFSPKPLHTAIFTHGHVDHCQGIATVDRHYAERDLPRVRVVSHELVKSRFERYQLSLHRNALVNGRQFQSKASFPSTFRIPDWTYHGEQATLMIGGIQFDLHHDKGETDDSTWIWIPQHKVLCTGDLFIWSTPNCGNPQKAQRYPREWAVGLRKMLKLDAEFLLPGHGPPIFGKERVREALTDTARLLESITQQSLDLINEGRSLNYILHAVKFPDDLIEKSYLRPIYDDPSFIIHNMWRLYGGWWDQHISHLRPVKDEEFARELTQLTGGPTAFLARAKILFAEHRYDMALALIEIATQAISTPDEAVHSLRAQILAAKESHEPSLMAKSIYRAARLDSEKVLNKL